MFTVRSPYRLQMVNIIWGYYFFWYSLGGHITWGTYILMDNYLFATGKPYGNNQMLLYAMVVNYSILKSSSDVVRFS